MKLRRGEIPGGGSIDDDMVDRLGKEATRPVDDSPRQPVRAALGMGRDHDLVDENRCSVSEIDNRGSASPTQPFASIP